MKSPLLVLLVPTVLLIGCGGPSGPKNTSLPPPSKPHIATLRLTVENRLKYGVTVEPMAGRRTGGSIGLGPSERLQKTKDKVSSKLIDLDLFSSPTEGPASEADVYLVHVQVSRDGRSYGGPEAYLALPPRIVDNAGTKGGRMTIEDKGISVTIGASTLYGAWIPPAG